MFKYVEKYERGEVGLVPAEERILERHRFYGAFYSRKKDLGPISERILTPAFVEAMEIRNAKIDQYPEFLEYVGAYLDRVVKPEINSHPRLAITAGAVGILACALLYRRVINKAKQAI